MEMGESLYEFRVRGHLAPHRFRIYEGFSIRHSPEGETVLVGPVRDQAALYGLLNWFQSIGVSLFSVQRLSGPVELRDARLLTLDQDEQRSRP